MKSLIIPTNRSWQTWPSWHLVYEWEDCIISEMSNAKLYCVSKTEKRLRNVLNKYLGLTFGMSSDLHLYFELAAQKDKNKYNRKNYIPIVIDFFLGKEEIPSFEKAYNKCPLVLITSKEAFDFLVENGCKLPLRHWGLSLPDKYKMDESVRYEKKFDFVLVGRQSPVLKDFLMTYVKKHPSIKYVEESKDEKLMYYTNNGEFVGRIESREEYINLVRQSRIALYATPSIDGGRKNTKDFNQVTPKFLEYISAQCHLILRYPKNSDTDFFELDKFGSSVSTYDEFETLVDQYLESQPDYGRHAEYLKNHYTSTRVKELEHILEEL